MSNVVPVKRDERAKDGTILVNPFAPLNTSARNFGDHASTQRLLKAERY